jgi:ketosteroid isomerase-like protein
MNASPQTQAAVQATLQQWKDAYTQRDLDRALAVIAPDDDVVGIGTGPDEWRVGPEEFRAQIERDFAQSEALSLNYEPLVVSEAGPVAWVAGRATVQARIYGQELTLTGRFTAVLEQRGDRWLLMQTHFSLPAAEQVSSMHAALATLIHDGQSGAWSCSARCARCRL